MNNFIIISRTFTETTPESVEGGDFSDMGVITEYEEVTFRELVGIMRIHNIASRSPNNYGISVWYECYPFITDYKTGTERIEYVHFSLENTPNAVKYWRWAAKYVEKVFLNHSK